MAARHARLVQVEAQEAVSEEVADRAAQLGSHELAAPLPAASAGYFPILEIEFPLLAAQQAAKASVQVAGFPDELAAQLAAQAAARLGLAPKLAAGFAASLLHSWMAPALRIHNRSIHSFSSSHSSGRLYYMDLWLSVSNAAVNSRPGAHRSFVFLWQAVAYFCICSASLGAFHLP